MLNQKYTDLDIQINTETKSVNLRFAVLYKFQSIKIYFQQHIGQNNCF